MENNIITIGFKNFAGADISIEQNLGDGSPVTTLTKSCDLIKLLQISEHINNNLNQLRNESYTMHTYQYYDRNIEADLDEEENFDTNEYSCGANFVIFINEKSGYTRVTSNHEASKIIQEEFAKTYPDNTLIFDPEYSYCYITTTSKDEARSFRFWAYENYYKPWVMARVESWKQFIIDRQRYTKEEQLKWDFPF